MNRIYLTIANTPHQAGPSPSSADLEWGTPRCVHYCSELQSRGHSFHPEDSQGGGYNYTVILGLPHPALGQWELCPGMTHIPTWFLALWSAPALMSMSKISRLPYQAARWITVKPCFPKKRQEKHLSREWALSQSTKAKLIFNCWKLTNREKFNIQQKWYFNSMGKRNRVNKWYRHNWFSTGEKNKIKSYIIRYTHKGYTKILEKNLDCKVQCLDP